MDFVVGFMFNPSRTHVLLIAKKRPSWQAGLLNGVGGKVGPGEPPICAMIREFEEETSLITTYTDWKLLCKYNVREVDSVYFYVAVGDITSTKSVTDEFLQIVPVTDLYTYGRMVDNLYWLIPMAYWQHVNPVVFEEVY